METSLRDRVLTGMERREALRAGEEVRPGKFVQVEITSRAYGAHAGVIVNVGTATYEVHEADVPALKAMIDAPGSDERKAAMIRFDADKAKWSESKGKGVRPSYEAAFQTVTSRSLQPFDAVRVVSDKAKG